MKEFGFVIIGGLIAYFGSIINHALESRRNRKNDLRQEKIRIYSDVIKNIGSVFIDKDNLERNFKDPLYISKFSLWLGSVLAPARLVADKELNTLLRELFEAEVKCHKKLFEKKDDEEKEDDEEKNDELNNAAKFRYMVESEMRKEITLS